MLRTCKDCQIQKNIEKFYKKLYKKNNYVWIAHTCSECKRIKDKEQQAKRREEQRTTDTKSKEHSTN